MPDIDRTCPVCGMGFMTIEETSAHEKKGHVTEKVPEPMPVVEAAPEPLPPTETITQPVPEAGIGVFEIICDSVGTFRFHLKAANGQIIAVSQSYLSKQSAENGIASMKTNAPMAKIIDQTIAAI